MRSIHRFPGFSGPVCITLAQLVEEVELSPPLGRGQSRRRAGQAKVSKNLGQDGRIGAGPGLLLGRDAGIRIAGIVGAGPRLRGPLRVPRGAPVAQVARVPLVAAAGVGGLARLAAAPRLLVGVDARIGRARIVHAGPRHHGPLRVPRGTLDAVGAGVLLIAGADRQAARVVAIPVLIARAGQALHVLDAEAVFLMIPRGAVTAQGAGVALVAAAGVGGLTRLGTRPLEPDAPVLALK